MTTYAPPPVLAPDQNPAYWTATPPGGGMPLPTLTGRRRRGVVAAWIAVATAAAAVTVSGVNVSTPQAAPVHKVVVPAAPVAPSADEIANAKKQACSAWTVASTAIASASNATAAAPTGWNDPIAQAAMAAEAQTTVTESKYLLSQLTPAAPAVLRESVNDYVAANYEQEHWTLRRNGPKVDAAIARANTAIDKINSACV